MQTKKLTVTADISTKLTVTALLICSVLLPLAGQSAFDLTVKPGVDFPFGPRTDAGEHPYGIIAPTGNITGNIAMPFWRPLALRLNVDYAFLPTKDGEDLDGSEILTPDMQMLSLGGAVGLNLYPVDRLGLHVSGGGGYWMAFWNDDWASNLFVKAEAGVSLRLAPAVSIGVGGGYRHLFAGKNPETGKIASFYQGVSVTLGTIFTFGAGGDLEVQEPQFESVFPIFYKYYNDNALGRISLNNPKDGEVRNLRVTFNVPQFMEKPNVGARIDRLGGGDSVEVPLYALFTDSVLRITEDTLVTSEILVEYEYLGKDYLIELTEPFRMHNRNALTWDDDRKAMAVFQGLGLYGMTYVIDPTTPYAKLSRAEDALDFLQFPAQTLAYKAGDCDDLSILYSALLESLGIECAFITIPGHIFMAFALEVSPADAGTIFRRPDDLILKNGKVWLPVEITLVSEGFLRAWRIGAKQWREAVGRDSAGFYPVRSAWELYEPVGTPDENLDIFLPDSGAVAASFGAELNSFVELELQERVAELRGRMADSGNPKYANRLAVLYARYGLYGKAADVLELPARDGYVPALVNLGNVRYLTGSAEDALRLYARAVELSPGNKTALLGVARANYELERYQEVASAFRDLEEQAPELAAEYSYLISGREEAARASEAVRSSISEWEEEE